jgi:hypothetical protein
MPKIRMSTGCRALSHQDDETEHKHRKINAMLKRLETFADWTRKAEERYYEQTMLEQDYTTFIRWLKVTEACLREIERELE